MGEIWYESGSRGEGAHQRLSLFVIRRSGRFFQEVPALFRNPREPLGRQAAGPPWHMR